jgi:hypothetical protein
MLNEKGCFQNGLRSESGATPYKSGGNRIAARRSYSAGA